MESLACHLFVVGTAILLYFAADSSPLDCCGLLVLFVCLVLMFFPPYSCR